MLILAPRRGSPWPWASLGCTSDTLGCASGLADWPLAAHSAPAPAPAATPASAAAFFRNRLRPDPLEPMIASLIRISDLSLALARMPSSTNFIVFGKVESCSEPRPRQRERKSAPRRRPSRTPLFDPSRPVPALR